MGSTLRLRKRETAVVLYDHGGAPQRWWDSAGIVARRRRLKKLGASSHAREVLSRFTWGALDDGTRHHLYLLWQVYRTYSNKVSKLNHRWRVHVSAAAAAGSNARQTSLESGA